MQRLSWLIPALALAVMTLLALLAPWISPQNPYDLKQIRLEDGYLPPVWKRAVPGADARTAPGHESSASYWLGTDQQGRDILSAVLYGLRVSLMVGVSGTAVALILGVGLGLASGWRGGRIDMLIMRVADIQLSFPSVLIALFLMAALGSGVGKIIAAVGLVHWVVYARVTRGRMLAEREKDYVQAVRALGVPTGRILMRHLLPNLAGPILILSAVQFASVVMLEATLSYLGLGVPITRPSLGMLIKFGYEDFYSGYWWVWFFPGAALVLLIVSINRLVDVIRAGDSG